MLPRVLETHRSVLEYLVVRCILFEEGNDLNFKLQKYLKKIGIPNRHLSTVSLLGLPLVIVLDTLVIVSQYIHPSILGNGVY